MCVRAQVPLTLYPAARPPERQVLVLGRASASTSKVSKWPSTWAGRRGPELHLSSLQGGGWAWGLPGGAPLRGVAILPGTGRPQKAASGGQVFTQSSRGSGGLRKGGPRDPGPQPHASPNCWPWGKSGHSEPCLRLQAHSNSHQSTSGCRYKAPGGLSPGVR